MLSDFILNEEQGDSMLAVLNTIATNTGAFGGRDEDTAHSTGDAGTGMLGVRQDIISASVSADGDYGFVKLDANGALYVNISAGSSIGTEFSEDTAHTPADAGVQIFAVRQDSLASSVDSDGDYGHLKINDVGRLYTTTTIDAALPAGTNNIGDVDIASLPGTSEADISAIKTATETVATAVSTEMQVDIVGSLPAGTAAIGKLSANSGVDIGDVDVISLPNVTLASTTNTIEVVGDAAENAAVAGNPLLTGGRYDASPRTLGDGDVGALALDADGAIHIADGGNSITVDGTITETNSSSIDSTLTTIDADTGDIATDTAVIAADTTSMDALLTTIDTDTGAIAGSVATIAAAVSTEMQVDIVGSLPAGTAAIGKLSPNSGVDIGDVDVTSLPNVTLAATTNTIEVVGDAAENAAAVGNPLLTGGRYDASPRTLGTGDVGAIALAVDGAIHIDDGGNSITVDGTITEANSTAILADTASIDTNVGTIAGAVSGSEIQVDIVSGSLTNTEYAEDSIHASGNLGIQALTVRKNTAVSLSGTDGDYQPLITDTNGRLHVLDQNSAAILADTASINTNVATVAGAVSGSEMQVDVLTMPTITETNSAAILSDTTAILADTAAMDTNLGIIAGAVSGSEVQVDVLTLPGIGGLAAEDAAASGNPVLTGGRYDSTPRVLENGDAGAIAISPEGYPLVELRHSTHTIGKLGANSGVDIGDVDVTSLPGSVESDLTAIKTAVEILDNAIAGSEMQVDIVSIPTITETNSAAILADTAAMDTNLATIAGDTTAIETAVELLDDTVFTDDAAFTVTSSKLLATGMMFDDTDSDPVNEGDIGIGRMSGNRAAHIELRDAAGNERGANINASNELSVVETSASSILSDTTAILADTASMDTALASIKTAVQLLDNSAASVGTDQIRVDIVSGSIANTEYAEDSAHSTGHLGVMGLTVRTDTASARAGALNDYQPFITDDNGRLHVIDENSAAILTDTGTIADDTTSMDGKLSTIDTDTGNIATSVATIAAAVSTEMQVDIVGSLPAGTAAIGKLAANSGVDIGDVDILTLPDVTLAATTNTIEIVGDAAENAAAAGNPVLIGGRYDASPRTLGNTDVGAIALDADGAVQISDGGNTITIDGTVTETNSGAINTSLNNIETDAAAIEVLLIAMDSDTDAIKTATETIAAAVTTEMQVDVVGSLPAGSAAIGKLAPNDGVDIGDVDVTSLPSEMYSDDFDSGGGTVNAYATGVIVKGAGGPVVISGDLANGLDVDVTRVSGTVTTVVGSALPAGDNNIGNVDIVTLPNTVESDLTAIKTAVEIIDNAISGNEMQVDIVSGGTGSTQYIEDTAHAPGDTGTMALAVRNDTLATLGGTDGDYVALQVTAAGAMYVDETNSAAILSDTTGILSDTTAILADTAAMDTNLATLAAAVSTQMQVDVVASLPAGDANIGNVDVVTLPGTVASDITAIKTAVEIIDNAISGSEMQVDIVSGAGGSQYAEDTQHVTADVGTMTLAVRNDTLAALAGSDGDYAPIQVNASGAVYTLDSNSAAILADTASMDTALTTLAGAVSGSEVQVDIVSGGTGSTQYVEDVAHSPGDTGTMMLGVRNDTLATLVGTDGDYAPIQVDADGAIYTLDSNSTAIAATLDNISYVLGTGQLRQNTQVDDLANTVDTIRTSALGYVYDGTTWDRMRGDSTSGVTVNLGSNNDVTVTSLPNTVESDISAIKTAVEIIDNAISGNEMQVDIVSGGTGSTQYVEDTTHNTGDTGTMSLAVRNDTLATLAGTDGDYAPLQVNSIGALYVRENNSAAILADTAAMDTNLAIIAGAIHNEDDAVTSADPGIAILTKRQDSPAAQSANNDYVPLLTNDTGHLFTHDENSDLMMSQTTTIMGSGVAASSRLGSIWTDTTSMAALLTTIDADTSNLTTIASDTSAIDTSLDNIELGFAVEGQALGRGVLLQGDDGTDRTNVAVDTAGHLQVDILSGASAGTQYAEDAVAGSGDLGTMALAVRANTPAATAANGDYVPLLTDTNGRLHVLDANSATIAGDTTSMDALLTAIDIDTSNLGAMAADLAGIDTDTGNIAAGFATDGSAEGSGVLIQGHDGTNRKNINVDASTGDVQVDVTNTVTVDLGANNDVTITSGAITETNSGAMASDLAEITIDTGELAGMAIDLSTIDVDTGVMAMYLATIDSDTSNLTAMAADLAGIDTDTGAIAASVATIAGDTTSLDGKDLMLGSDFSSVFGTNQMFETSGADNKSNNWGRALTVANFNYLFDGSTWDRARGDSTGGQYVQGNVAENDYASGAGNPLLIAGRYDSSPRSLNSGDVGAIAISNEGYVKVEGESLDNAALGVIHPVTTGGKVTSMGNESQYSDNDSFVFQGNEQGAQLVDQRDDGRLSITGSATGTAYTIIDTTVSSSYGFVLEYLHVQNASTTATEINLLSWSGSANNKFKIRLAGEDGFGVTAPIRGLMIPAAQQIYLKAETSTTFYYTVVYRRVKI